MHIRFRDKSSKISFYVLFSIIFLFFLLIVFGAGKNTRTAFEGLAYSFGCVIVPFLFVAYLYVLMKKMTIELTGRTASQSKTATNCGPLVVAILWSIAAIGIISVQDKQRCGNVEPGAYLRECSYAHKDFSGRDLHEADFKKADLSYANLSNANLQGTYLYATNLTHAVLTGAQLDQATLVGANAVGVTGLTREQLDRAKDWHGLLFEERASIIQKLGSVCQGAPLPNVLVDRPGQSVFSPLVLLDSDGSESVFTSKVPLSWWPATAENVRFVACVNEIEKTTYCNYTNCGSTEVLHKGINIRIIDATTGYPVDFFTLYKEYSCPSQKSCRSGDAGTDHATSGPPDNIASSIQALEARVGPSDPISMTVPIPQ